MEYKPVACILGSILINLTLGSFYSIGNVTPYLVSYMRNNGNPDVTKEQGTWLTATYLLGQGVFLIIGSFIERHFNSRIACIFGCVIHSLSTFLTMWAINVNFLAVILVYGLGSGMGCGSTYISSIISAQKWFPRRKGVMTGVIVSAFGFGGLIFTNFQTLYINPDNRKQDSNGYFDKQVYDRVPNLFLYLGLTFAVVQSVGCSLAFSPPANSHTSDPQPNHSTSQPKSPGANSITIVDEGGIPELTGLSSAFGYRIFYVIGAMMMMVAPGVTLVNSLGKTFGETYIDDDRFLSAVIALAAIANSLGRLCWGFLISRYSFSTCYTCKIALFSSLIFIFPFEFILQTKSLYLICVLGLFFGFSGTFVLFPVFIEQVFGSVFHGTIYGILYIVLALSSNLTSLLIQLIIVPSMVADPKANEVLMTRLTPCLAIALLYIASLAIYIFFIPYKRLELSIARKIDRDYVSNLARESLFSRKDLYPLERGTLAEKTTRRDGITKENSLGSIVRYRDSAGNESKKIISLGKH